MCEREAGLDRRELMGLLVGAGCVLMAPSTVHAGNPAVTRPSRAPIATANPLIRPRSDWAGDLPPAIGLPVEAAGDVRVLLVHHTATQNGYAADSVPRQISSFHRYHTTTKGWPDVAYNFFVDAYGGIWEGRSGSLAGPVIGDATGGNQGFTQLCCFIGDHSTEPPSPAAQTSMSSLLAFLADRYAVDPTPGATATFTSRGSNRWPAGSEVTAATISGHRAMSQTTCPGDAAQVLVDAELPSRVASLLDAPTATTTPPPPPVDVESDPATSSTEVATTGTSTSSTTTAPRSETTTQPIPTPATTGAPPADPGSPPTELWPVAAGAAAVTATAVGVRRFNRRRTRSEQTTAVAVTDPPDAAPEG